MANSVTDFLAQTCIHIRRLPSSATDKFGNPRPNESDETLACSLQLKDLQISESRGESETTNQDYDLFLPAGTVIRTGDRVVVDGFRYEVIGDGWTIYDWRTGSPHHTECSVRRTGATEDTS